MGRRITEKQADAALETLARLSELSDDSELRDHIGRVRDALWDVAENGGTHG